MTIRELSVELGVSTVYMEDEVALLEKYGLLNALPGGKYQTNLVIFTVDYIHEFYCSISDLCTAKVGKILHDVKALLPDIRQIGFCGSTMETNRLLWSFLFPIMHRGHTAFEETHDATVPDTIYDGATGINFGRDYDTSETDKICKISEYSCSSFAGYSKFDDKYAIMFADFGLLPKSNLYGQYGSRYIKESLDSNEGRYAKFTKEQLSAVEALLEPCVRQMTELYDVLTKEGTKLMKVHAPKNVAGMVDKIVAQTVFFTTVGLIGKCAVDSGELKLPVESGPIAVLVYEIGNMFEASESLDVLV